MSALDRATKTVTVAERRPIPYDMCSMHPPSAYSEQFQARSWPSPAHAVPGCCSPARRSPKQRANTLCCVLSRSGFFKVAPLKILAHAEAVAMTDVTGFGPAVHLFEILRESGVGVELKLDAISIFDGALESATSGLR